jgi:hypothetical protein
MSYYQTIKFITRSEAVTFRDEAQKAYNDIVNKSPVLGGLGKLIHKYTGSSAFAKTVVWIAKTGEFQVKSDLQKEINMYKTVISRYDQGYTGVEVREDFEYIKTTMNGFPEEGWITKGVPFISALRTSSGHWMSML